MSSLLKDIYSESFYDKFSEIISHTIPSFNPETFKDLIFIDDFQNYELKSRMTHTAMVLNHFLSDDFDEAAVQITSLIENLKKSELNNKALECMFLPEYVAKFGLDHFRCSVSAMELITQFTSCEFAVRPFLLKYSDKMLEQMLKWSAHRNYHVRRLASEGARPRLPWAMAIPGLKKDPAPLLPVLENLKQDKSEYVRRSVANNLNDISKDNPGFVKEIADKWFGISKETDAIVKHGCRTLLKQGDKEILKLFGFDCEHFTCSGFNIQTQNVRHGKALKFSFGVTNLDHVKRPVRLEYGLYYRKKSGSLSKKVFKISERELDPGQHLAVERKQSFRPVTTRRYYSGEHKLSVIVNGKESELKSFILMPHGQ